MPPETEAEKDITIISHGLNNLSLGKRVSATKPTSSPVLNPTYAYDTSNTLRFFPSGDSLASSMDRTKRRHWFQRFKLPLFKEGKEDGPLHELETSILSPQTISEYPCYRKFRTEVEGMFEQLEVDRTPVLEELQNVEIPLFAPLHEVDLDMLELLRNHVFGLPVLASSSESLIFIEELYLAQPVSFADGIAHLEGEVPEIHEHFIVPTQKTKPSQLRSTILSTVTPRLGDVSSIHSNKLELESETYTPGINALYSSIQSSRDLILDLKISPTSTSESISASALAILSQPMQGSSEYNPLGYTGFEEQSIMDLDNCVSSAQELSDALPSAITSSGRSPNQLELLTSCFSGNHHLQDGTTNTTSTKRQRLQNCPTNSHKPKDDIDFLQRLDSLVRKLKAYHITSGKYKLDSQE